MNKHPNQNKIEYFYAWRSAMPATLTLFCIIGIITRTICPPTETTLAYDSITAAIAAAGYLSAWGSFEGMYTTKRHRTHVRIGFTISTLIAIICAMNTQFDETEKITDLMSATYVCVGAAITLVSATNIILWIRTPNLYNKLI